MTLAAPRDFGLERFGDGRAARFLFDLLGYGLVSGLALASDCGLLLVLVWLGANYLAASMLSFSAGMVISYMLNVRFVFADRRRALRDSETVGFFVVGVAGLALTQVLLYVFVARLGFVVALAKIPTTAIVFLFNFLSRRSLVFKASRDA